LALSFASLVLAPSSLAGIGGIVYMHVKAGLTQPLWLAMNVVLGVLAMAFAVWLSRRLRDRAKSWRKGLIAVMLPAVLMLASMWAFLGSAPGSAVRLVSMPGTYLGSGFFFVPFLLIVAYVLAGFGRRSGPAGAP
jgi:vacuolar-type H+-ATPase subunit I/STV1